MEELTNIKISKWKELGTFFSERFKSPFEHPEYVFYFLIAVIGAGGIGIWTSIFGLGLENNQNSIIIQSISAFSVAVIATGSIELFFVKNKYIKTTLFIISFCFISLSILSYLICFRIGYKYGYFISISTSVFALLIWWIANAENANLTKNYFVEQSDKSKELDESLNQYGDE